MRKFYFFNLKKVVNTLVPNSVQDILAQYYSNNAPNNNQNNNNIFVHEDRRQFFEQRIMPNQHFYSLIQTVRNHN